jgi:predicted ABC-type ATPase
MKRPSIVIVAGVNGCGKSTFAATAAGKSALLGQTAINPDELTQAATVEFPVLKGAGANLVGVERAEKAVWRAIAEGKSAAIETVLSSAKFLPLVAAARRRRYRTRLIFIGLPKVDLAIERIRTRVTQGGHDVPDAKVRDRWNRAHDNLVIFMQAVDDVLIFSNVGPIPIPVAERVGRGSLRLIDELALPAVSSRLLSPKAEPRRQ